jgi:hypothetical protein
MRRRSVRAVFADKSQFRRPVKKLRFLPKSIG